MQVSKLLLTIAFLICISIAAQPSTPAQAGLSNADDRLVNTEWRFTSFGAGQAQTPVVEGTIVTLKFGADGHAGGSSGCNTYRGEYRVQGNTVSFSRIISTKRACLDTRANRQEQRYLRLLDTASFFRLADDRLTILDDARRITLNFVRPSDSSSKQGRYEDLTNPVSLIASFYDAVNLEDYGRAYRYWESPPASLDDFAGGYGDTISVQLIVEPPTNIEGAAGSLFAEVPTMVVALERNGSERLFSGCYVTRKRNGPAGVNPARDVWRIYRAKLSPVAAGESIPQLLTQACRK